jgi:hypothetical protein
MMNKHTKPKRSISNSMDIAQVFAAYGISEPQRDPARMRSQFAAHLEVRNAVVRSCTPSVNASKAAANHRFRKLALIESTGAKSSAAAGYGDHRKRMLALVEAGAAGKSPIKHKGLT